MLPICRWHGGGDHWNRRFILEIFRMDRRTFLKTMSVSAISANACGVKTDVVNTSGESFDNFSDTWVATDGLGRTLPTAPKVRTARHDRFIAMLYFLWHMPPYSRGGPYDVSRIKAADPVAMRTNASPPWGPLLAYHYWGEPLFGYYLSDDQWVLRKHAQLLAAAGVDTLILGYNNGATYPVLMQVFSEMRKAGQTTPQVVFLTDFWNPHSIVAALYQNLYSKGLHEELWFKWHGKPLILANPALVAPTLHGFFTFRNPQPSYFTGSTEPDQWSWLEVYPQHVFRNKQGQKEQMAVGIAQNAIGGKLGYMSNPLSRGRSWRQGHRIQSPQDTPWGFNAVEQWSHALQEDPQVVFFTGWNEWIAGRFRTWGDWPNPGYPIFVDEFDPEYSRDIEPMRGGFGDAYYYQFVSYARRFKGARQPPRSGPPRSINLQSDWTQWHTILPNFYGCPGITAHRNHPGVGGITRYVNTSGRNNIIVMKVAYDQRNIYFYARTAQPLTSPSGRNWMNLFINTDCNPTTGWHGYNYVINRRMVNSKTGVLEWTQHGWNWQTRAQIPMRLQGDQLMLMVPRHALGLSGQQLTFEFKWADNFQREDDINAFLLYGDAAPPGRFNYLFTTV